MCAAAIEEISGDAALVLGERAEPATGVDRLHTQTVHDRLMDDALKPSAVNGELRPLMAGFEAALLVPALLAMARQIEQLMGADRDFIEPIQQADACQLADCMGQRADVDPELAAGIRMLTQ